MVKVSASQLTPENERVKQMNRRRGYTKGKGIEPGVGANIADRIAWRQLRKLRDLEGRGMARYPLADPEANR